MLTVKPVPDCTLAEELCAACNVHYNPEAFLYMAADTDTDSSHINYIIGICTFVMRGGRNEIERIVEHPGVSDEEAMIITVRAVMNFMYRCEVKTVTLAGGATEDAFAKKLGFSNNEGHFSIDLEKFYRSPCSFNGLE